MRIAIGAALLAATIFPALASAKEPVQSGGMVLKSLEKFASGLNDKSKRSLEPDVAITMGYIIGVIDADGSICFDPSISMAQAMLSIRDYLKGHQDLLDKSGVVGISNALRETHACRSKSR